MAWVSPSTRATGTLITSSIWNQDIVSNTLALKDPNNDFVNLTGEANKTTTSTSFVDVDAAGDPDYSLSVVIEEDTDLLVHFNGMCQSPASGNLYFDVTVDGTRIGAAGADGLTGVNSTGATQVHTCLTIFRRYAVTAGTLAVVLQWRVTAGTGTLYTNTMVTQFSAQEGF